MTWNKFGLSSYAKDRNSLTSHPSQPFKMTHSYFTDRKFAYICVIV